MDADDRLTREFEANRAHLRAVAQRMLGSATDADDALQEAWLRFQRTDTSDVQNLGGWLTTVVSRVCLDVLRSRRARPAGPSLDQAPEVVPLGEAALDPAEEAALADTMGPALLLVLDTLAPAERLAFVLHDLFAVPFDEIAPIVGRTPAATRQLASRGRRRIQGGEPAVAADRARQRRVVEAFLAASRAGDFEGLLAVLDPDVRLRADATVLAPGAEAEAVGAEAVAGRARLYGRGAARATIVLADGAPAAATMVQGRPRVVLAFVFEDDRVVELDVIADPDRLAQLDLVVLDDQG